MGNSYIYAGILHMLMGISYAIFTLLLLIMYYAIAY